MTPLPELRFVMLSGKGGVGRTTVAATLARVAAQAGKRVLLAEATTADRLGRMFGRQQPLGNRVETLAPGIDGVNITPDSALREYGTLVLHSELVARALFENRAVRGFLGAIPGLDAYAILGKVWWHTTELVAGRPRYDLVLFDGPATGHAGLMLHIPQAIVDAMPKGPLARDARAIGDLLRIRPAPRSRSSPSPRSCRPGRPPSWPRWRAGPSASPSLPWWSTPSPPPSSAPPSVTDVLARGPAANPELDATLRLAAGVRAHRRAAELVLDTLARDPGLPLVTLPRIPSAELGPAIVAELLPHLAAGLGQGPRPRTLKGSRTGSCNRAESDRK